MTMMGAGLLWVGWFGFNAGSTVQSGLDTARALTMTQISAASGALSWMLIEALHLKKATSLGFVTGILAGLVVITPAAGVVQPYGAILLGAASSLVCYGAILLKYKLGYDDTLDVFGVHGVGSGLGVLLLSFFIRPSWMAEAAQKAGGAWTAINQLGVQAAGMAITIVYAGLLTLVLIWSINKVLGFRLEEQDEVAGMDQSLHGEHGYGLLDSR
jgi:Amt family ammonium transporter